jgi:hypothetical protein
LQGGLGLVQACWTVINQGVLDNADNMHTALFYSFSLLYLCLSIARLHPDTWTMGLLFGTFGSLVVPNRTGSVTTTVPSGIKRNNNPTDELRV